MSSLVFRALDAHIVHGRADAVALDDGSASWTYAQLLAEAAAIAGGLHHLGVRQGTPVAIEAGGVVEVITVLACARLGAVPEASAQCRVAGDPPAVCANDEWVPWATVLRIGRTDPEAAPETDEPGYADALQNAYTDMFATLIAGGTIS